jgi:hypothetical protein
MRGTSLGPLGTAVMHKCASASVYGGIALRRQTHPGLLAAFLLAAVLPVWTQTSSVKIGQLDLTVGGLSATVTPAQPGCPSLAMGGGSRECLRKWTFPLHEIGNQIAQAASPPTLAKNARIGHPLWEWRMQISLKVGHPPIRTSFVSGAN